MPTTTTMPIYKTSRRIASSNVVKGSPSSERSDPGEVVERRMTRGLQQQRPASELSQESSHLPEGACYIVGAVIVVVGIVVVAVVVDADDIGVGAETTPIRKRRMRTLSFQKSWLSS